MKWKKKKNNVKNYTQHVTSVRLIYRFRCVWCFLFHFSLIFFFFLFFSTDWPHSVWQMGRCSLSHCPFVKCIWRVEEWEEEKKKKKNWLVIKIQWQEGWQMLLLDYTFYFTCQSFTLVLPREKKREKSARYKSTKERKFSTHFQSPTLPSSIGFRFFLFLLPGFSSDGM